MIKLIYKTIGFIYTSFLLFIFTINYYFLSFKENAFLRIYYSIKINLIYYLFYIVYISFYLKYFRKTHK